MMNRTTTNRGRLPTTFEGLNRRRPLYAIHDEIDYDNAQEMVDALAILDSRTEGQEAYLESLATLMEAYEREHHVIDTSDIGPVEALRYLLDQHGMNASDLGRLLGNRQIGSAILRGARQLSKTHIQKLSRYFHIRPDVFMATV